LRLKDFGVSVDVSGLPKAAVCRILNPGYECKNIFAAANCPR
jgi:hypothetical protein